MSEQHEQALDDFHAAARDLLEWLTRPRKVEPKFVMPLATDQGSATGEA